MRPLLTLLRGLGLLLLVVGLLVPMSVSATAQDDGGSSDDAFSVFAGVLRCEGPTEPRLVLSECETTPGVDVTIVDPASGSTATCTTNDIGGCSVPAPFGAETVLTVDPATVPEGYVAQDEETPYSVPDSQAAAGGAIFSVQIALIPISAGMEGPVSDSSQEPAPAATETLTAETDGSTAAIYAGDCDGDFADEPVATLTNVRPPDGDPAGADTASAVETSFTSLDLPLDDILADDHVLVVFDEDDDTVPLACGAIGGIVTEDGSLAFGLPAVGESRYSGVAYLSEDGDQTDATLFLAEDLDGGDATPAA